MQVRHLTSLGHTKIGFVSFRMSIITERERRAGYIEGITDFCPKGEKCHTFLCRQTFKDEVLPLIESGEITALAVVNDMTAMEIIRDLEKWGISVPEDISVIGFDDWKPARYMIPALTTIAQDFISIGWQGARLLYEAMNDKTILGKTVLNPVSLVERESTRSIILKN